MRKTSSILTATLVMGSLLLAGCGSDSDDVAISDPGDNSQTPGEGTPIEKPAYFDVNVVPNAVSEGYINVMLGVYDDKITRWQHTPEAFESIGLDKVAGTPAIPGTDLYRPTLRDANYAGVYNEPQDIFTYDLEEVSAVLNSNPDGLGAGTARPDIFKPGHYSAFDLLRYLAATRADLEINNVVHWQKTGLGTYTFDVSFDRNGDGDFDDEGDSLNNPNWHFRFKQNTGEDGQKIVRVAGNMQGLAQTGELTYFRMDEHWVEPRMLVSFQSFSDEMTARRQWIQRQEVEDYEANGGVAKVNIRAVVLKNEQNVISLDSHAEALQVEVKSFNHRSDVYQPGVLTIMDAVLSAQEALGGVKFAYWDSLSTGSEVGHYAVSEINGIHNKGLEGWFLNVFPPSIAEIDPFWGFFHRDFRLYPVCDWAADGSAVGHGGDGTVSQEICNQDWAGAFGGADVHRLPDAHTINFGHQNIQFFLAEQYTLFNPEAISADKPHVFDLDSSEEGEKLVTVKTLTLPTEPVGSAAILDEAHFGWGIADCTQCHNESKDPNGHGGYSWPINTADGFDVTQPHYCATCHGNNGAPQTHGETARCFFCHGGKKTPPNHGEASTKRLILGEDNFEANKEENMHRMWKYTGIPVDEWGNYQPMKELWHGKNSDWSISEQFPDPYSCMTCHTSPE